MVLEKQVKDIYSLFLVKKLINNFSKCGHTSKVENILFSSLARLKFKKTFRLFLLTSLLLYILDEIKPSLELRVLRLGSIVYKIPVPLSSEKQCLKAIKLLRFAVKQNKGGVCLEEVLYKEFLLILQKKSSLFSLLEETYKIASKNRVLAHYRWT